MNKTQLIIAACSCFAIIVLVISIVILRFRLRSTFPPVGSKVGIRIGKITSEGAASHHGTIIRIDKQQRLVLVEFSYVFSVGTAPWVLREWIQLSNILPIK